MKSNLKFAVFGIALLSFLAGAILAANSTASAATTQSGNQTMMGKNTTSAGGNTTSGNMTGSAGGMMAKNATK